MDRLILIGNGFDLAHGLKTSYSDFLRDYVANAINKFKSDAIFDDLLLRLSIPDPSTNIAYRLEKATSENALRILNEIKDNERYYRCEIKSTILKAGLERIDSLNWVDIENEYFQLLKEATRNSKYQKKIAEKVNTELGYISDKLQDYLRQQNLYNKNRYPDKNLELLFNDPFRPSDFLNDNIKSGYPDNVYILNFNYTNTASFYQSLFPSASINSIHGTLDDEKNPVIFGFGDEFDKSYLEFEDFNENELFKHIKSFKYLQTSNYHNLIRFLNNSVFQMCVFGHSCGLSDRTMLRKIVEHKNCRSIKIYYHKISEELNDYTNKTYELARHFRDKEMFREKIVAFPFCEPMPQPDMN